MRGTSAAAESRATLPSFGQGSNAIDPGLLTMNVSYELSRPRTRVEDASPYASHRPGPAYAKKPAAKPTYPQIPARKRSIGGTKPSTVAQATPGRKSSSSGLSQSSQSSSIKRPRFLHFDGARGSKEAGQSTRHVKMPGSFQDGSKTGTRPQIRGSSIRTQLTARSTD